jgi:hypothetical protein
MFLSLSSLRIINDPGGVIADHAGHVLQSLAVSSTASVVELDRARLPTEPLLSRFAPSAGFVTLRQTFVRRCQTL